MRRLTTSLDLPKLIAAFAAISLSACTSGFTTALSKSVNITSSSSTTPDASSSLPTPTGTPSPVLSTPVLGATPTATPASTSTPLPTPTPNPAATPPPIASDALAKEIAQPTFRNFATSYFTLSAGQQESVNGVSLQITSGGDLQVTNFSGTVLWHSGTSADCSTSTNCNLNLQGDGNLVLNGPSGGLWSSGTYNNNGAFLTLSSNDPYLTIHNGDFAVTWSSGTKISPPALLAASRVGSKAAPVRDFLKTLAVNSHVQQNGISAPDMLTMLNYLGVKTIRDGWSTSLADTYTTLAKNGIQFDLGVGDPYATGSFSGAEAIAAMSPGALVATEGPNEINNWSFVSNGVTSQNGWPNNAGPLVQQFMTKLFSYTHQDSKLSGVSVYDLTWGGTTDADKYGMFDLTNQADFGNIHFYPNGQPYSNLQTAIASNYHHVLPSQSVITETGFDTANMSENAQAILNLNLYLGGFQQGFQKIYIYELYDEWQTYGLFKNASTPKASATAIHNLTTILADSGSQSLTDSLGYQVNGLPQTAHTLLLEKSSGVFELIVWNEVPVTANKADLTVTPVNVTVNLSKSASKISVYDALTGTSAIQQSGATSSVSMSLSAHALIFEITP